MARNLLIEHPEFKARAVIDPDALRQHEDRGWVGAMPHVPKRSGAGSAAKSAGAQTRRAVSRSTFTAA